MTEIFFNAQSYPFTLSLTLVAGLFVLEIITMLLGGSFLSLEADAPGPELDLDTDFDLETEVEAAMAPSGMFGLKEVPFMMWLVSFLTMFGLTGLVLQSALKATFGAPLPAVLAALIALPAGLFGARFIARVIARIMPKHESEAMRTRFLGGHHGTITQGTAMRGKPAEAKIKDRFGNVHYLRVEPLDDADVIPQGAAVHVIRRKDGMFYVVDIT